MNKTLSDVGIMLTKNKPSNDVTLVIAIFN